MTKQELWLRVAAACTGYYERSEFKFRKVVQECLEDCDEAIAEFYGAEYPTEDNFYDREDERAAWERWYDALEKLQQDALDYIQSLIVKAGEA